MKRKTKIYGACCILTTSIYAYACYGFSAFSSTTKSRRIRETTDDHFHSPFPRFPFQLFASDDTIPFWMKEDGDATNKISDEKAETAKKPTMDSTTMAASSFESIGIDLQGELAQKAKTALDDTVDVSICCVNYRL